MRRERDSQEQRRRPFMRARTIALCTLLVATATACTKSADTSATTSATDATATATGSAMSSSGATIDDKTKLPLYPGGKAASSGSSANEAGTVLTTSDSFDKVYSWYKSKLPAGSEKAKIDTAGLSSATFQADVTGGTGTVAITSQGAKTVISLATTSH
jgi:hypothetical protein